MRGPEREVKELRRANEILRKASVGHVRQGVYGANLQLMGGFAEYALAPQVAVAHEPAGLTFEQASTLPQAGAIAV